MTHRPVVGRAAVLAAALLLLTLFASIPVPAAIAAKADPSVTQTGKRLPSAIDRLDGKEPREESAFEELAAAEQTGTPREDGTFELPPNYKENPERVPPGSSKGGAYNAERRGGGKKGGGIEVLRLDVSGGDVTANTTWAVADSPIVVSGTVNIVARPCSRSNPAWS